MDANPKKMASSLPFNKRTESLYWVFTLNNPANNDVPRDALTEHANYAVWQREVGQSGTHHLQGYVVLKRKQRLSALVKLMPGAHFEIRRGRHDQAKDYSTKSDTRQEGPWEIGNDDKVPRAPGQREDLNVVKEALDEGASMLTIAQEHFAPWCKFRNSFQAYSNLTAVPRSKPPKVYILWGVSGSGKSHRATQLAGDDAYWLSRPTQGDNLWWDGYTSGKNLVIDEFYSWIKYDFLLRILDRYPLSVPIKGSTAIFNSPVIVLTSNTDPYHWYAKVKDRSALHRRFEDFCEIIHLATRYVPPAVDSVPESPPPSDDSEPEEFNFALENL